MTHTRTRLVAAVLTVLAAFTAAPACATVTRTPPPTPAVATPAAATPAAAATPSAAPSEESGPTGARTRLAALTVAAPHPMTGFSRDLFPHWATVSGRCDAREIVLIRDGRDVVTDDQCRVVAGVWESPYDSKLTASSEQIDIDHLVSLGSAWRAGADLWPEATRREFANDLRHHQLIAVSASSNRAKRDSGPEKWQPVEAFRCRYAIYWIDVKFDYGLSTTPEEKNALTGMLASCPQRR
ncbi:DUF1524 domain-containing protein [Kitasatospora sp. NPDC056076]|uniref:GmrSD restriction endonuclease domain-containing protein n=1 Tax=Kitasatospora sp. NPDC056076 TaxID=3345703 RepID=UPI0035DDEE74